jgi:plasmid stabilization system protein ParE
MKVAIAPVALEDLREIGRTVAADNPTAAVRLTRRIRTACAALGDFPEHYSLDVRIGLRRSVVGAYLVFYRVKAAEVQIVRILHGARDYVAILGTDDPT